MKIIYYDENHLQGCASLFMSQYNHPDYGCQFDQHKAMLYLQEIVFKPRFVGLLVLHKKELAGFAFCHLRTWFDKDQLQVDELIIKEEFQNQGVATKVLGFLEDYAKNYELGGITFTTNALTLAKFYEKRGFLAHDVTFLYKGVIGVDPL